MDGHPSTELWRLVWGYRVSQAIHVAAVLGVADILAGGARTADEVATEVGADSDALYRLLRALAAAGVLHEDGERRFTLTPVGDCLRRDAPESAHGMAAMIGQPYAWNTWSALLHSVRTGENAFHHVHGESIWDYRAQHADDAAIFDRAMIAMTSRVTDAVLEAYDFGRFDTVTDVGGGRGTLIAAILARHPSVQGVLYDLPFVVAEAEPVLRAAGVADRCRLVEGSFFDSVPAGADAYVLKSVIHDWEDEESVAILRKCAEAAGAHGAVLLVERDLGAPNELPDAKFSDLNMLVLPGGRERTTDEYAALFERAGLRLDSVTPTAVGFSVFEGRLA